MQALIGSLDLPERIGSSSLVEMVIKNKNIIILEKILKEVHVTNHENERKGTFKIHKQKTFINIKNK